MVFKFSYRQGRRALDSPKVFKLGPYKPDIRVLTAGLPGTPVRRPYSPIRGGQAPDPGYPGWGRYGPIDTEGIEYPEGCFPVQAGQHFNGIMVETYSETGKHEKGNASVRIQMRDQEE